MTGGEGWQEFLRAREGITMREGEWLQSDDPSRMLDFLRRGAAVLVDELPTEAEGELLRRFLLNATTRKLRLFACCCCRRIWDSLIDERSRMAVEVAERFADGLATEEQRRAASHDAICARDAFRGNPQRRVAAHAAHVTAEFEIAQAASETANVLVWAGKLPSVYDAQTEQASLLRDIIGNPFRPVAFDPSWRTSDVFLLARGIYEERAFERMPILADALQDAGCTSEDILSHCRDANTPHARGCWVVDLVLGKA